MGSAGITRPRRIATEAPSPPLPWSGPSPYRPHPDEGGSRVITYLQAIVLGLVQGVTELFPISSLGQAVILPTVFGWDTLAQAQSQPESFYLAFIVGMHVATATALLIYFWSDWRRIIARFFRTIGHGAQERKMPWSVIRNVDER